MTLRDELLQHLLAHSFRTGEFTLASGRKSNYYINGKMTTLDARGAYLVGRTFLAMIADDVPDAVGGLTLGADPIIGAMIALSRAGFFPSWGLKSTSCLWRYSGNWPAILGLVAATLLPSAAWHAAQTWPAIFCPRAAFCAPAVLMTTRSAPNASTRNMPWSPCP